jgi:phage tail-like protein
VSPATPFSRLSEPDQWRRCRHDGTSLVDGGRGFELAWSEPDLVRAEPSAPQAPVGGLALDRWGRHYRSEPESGRVVVLPLGSSRSGLPPASGALEQPGGLAVDEGQRLYVAEHGRSRVLVVDLWAMRLTRAVPTSARDGRPVDVAADGYGVLALLDEPPGIVGIRGRRGPIPWQAPRPPGSAPGLRPSRLVLHPGVGVLVLWRESSGTRAAVCDVDGLRALEVPGATDLEVDGRGRLVVARAPGMPFRVWADRPGRWDELEPLEAADYDGTAIATDASGTIVFTTDTGASASTGSAARFVGQGRLLTYRLDSGAYGGRWGRVFLDACVPAGTAVRVAAITSDEDGVVDPLPARAPVHDAGAVSSSALTPPLPPAEQVARLARPVQRPVYRRTNGPERPWEQPAQDGGYETFETVVDAPPGRYLWLVVDLLGTSRTSPRVREIRVERAGHRLDRQLPRSWSRDEATASFLQRFLAPAEGMLHDLGDRASERASLLDPQTTPPETLDWLAGFLGLVLDRRWSLEARRELVAEAYDLYRLRGTRAALERLLGIYLGRSHVDIVENWRLRGLGGTTLGPPASGPRPPFVAEAGAAVEPLGSFVVGGPLPTEREMIAGSDTDTAHRFTVIMPVPLTAEQQRVVTSVIETHKPAHTRAEICELGDGMRIGRLRVALTSYVGSSSGWGPDIVGQVLLGTDGVVGIPDVAARVGDAVSGRVRVG